MFIVMICYKQDVPLDETYYFTKHVPMIEEAFGPLGMRKCQVQKVVGSAPRTVSPYQIMTSLYFDSAEVYQATFGNPAAAQVREDIPNFTQAQPDILFATLAFGG
jgi:uncharacterized protein (TIGR02118 family)